MSTTLTPEAPAAPTGPGYSKISPTAKLVSHFRTLTDIPFSRELAEACGAAAVFRDIVQGDPMDFLWSAPMVEMRYKAIDALLLRQQARQIVEVAAGVSPRGLIWSRKDGYIFFQTDLVDISREMEGMVRASTVGKPDRLHFFPLNAVNGDNFRSLDDRLDPDAPVTVIAEGLMPYLTLDEKARVAANVRWLLKRHGGVWITTDISANDRIKKLIKLDPRIQKVMDRISEVTGRDLKGNSFPTMEEAESFFRQSGFVVARHDQSGLVPTLSSLQKIRVDPAKLQIMQENACIWTLEVPRD
jgi:O-methyltransferase involved in polyketide biosynthesis